MITISAYLIAQFSQQKVIIRAKMVPFIKELPFSDEMHKNFSQK